MKSTCQHGARSARLLRDGMAPMSTNIVESIDIPILVPYQEKVPAEHLITFSDTGHEPV